MSQDPDVVIDSIPDVLPVLPLRGTVVFPMSVVPLAGGQERSVKLVDEAMRTNRLIVLVAQKDAGIVATEPGELFGVGTAAVIHQLMRVPDGSMRLIVHGMMRVRLSHFDQTSPWFVARVERAPEQRDDGVEIEALVRTARGLFQRLVALSAELPNELAAAAEALSDPIELVYQIAAATPLEAAVRQEMLELDPVSKKLKRLVEVLQHELAVRELERRITSETKEEMTKEQRDYFLREHLKTIRKELGEEEGRSFVSDLGERLAKAKLGTEARAEADRELARLEKMPEASPEYGIIRTFLEWMAALPWDRASGGAIDVARAGKVLDEDHYDLVKIKDRLLEYLAVKKLRDERAAELFGIENPNVAGVVGGVAQTPDAEARREPILLFLGAPGVGKTSLGQSIARAMGRKFVRMSLGGIHDEAEIRGHRRTYIGALPGRILQGIRRAEACDPVFMLDEVDKLGVGFHGDPAAALMEVLDPAQNYAFVDTYLGVPFDLSRVLFICTANTTDHVPPALLDRMEMLQLPGYTESEKLQIAKRYLVPRMLKANGLLPGEVELDDPVIRRIVREYTREAGVRNIERSIATLFRKVARRLGEGTKPPVAIGLDDLTDLLGPPRFINEMSERIDRPGIATGLAWTPAGGDILFVEATMMPSSEEKLLLTGMLGDVMRESAQAALSYLRSNATRLGIPAGSFDGKTVHIHIPAGAIPKDGPSAGVALLVALASLATGRAVKNDLAMTGEISLRGRLLKIGGVKEKLLAAHAAGVRMVILPSRNKDDLVDVPQEIRDDLKIELADSVEEVLAEALGPSVERRAPVEEPVAVVH